MLKAKIIFLPNRINGMEGTEAIDQQRAIHNTYFDIKTYL